MKPSDFLAKSEEPFYIGCHQVKILEDIVCTLMESKNYQKLTDTESRALGLLVAMDLLKVEDNEVVRCT